MHPKPICLSILQKSHIFTLQKWIWSSIFQYWCLVTGLILDLWYALMIQFPLKKLNFESNKTWSQQGSPKITIVHQTKKHKLHNKDVRMNTSYTKCCICHRDEPAFAWHPRFHTPTICIALSWLKVHSSTMLLFNFVLSVSLIFHFSLYL